MTPIEETFTTSFEALWDQFTQLVEASAVDASSDDQVWYASLDGRYLLLLIQYPSRFVGIISDHTSGNISLPLPFVLNFRCDADAVNGSGALLGVSQALVTGISGTSLINVAFGAEARKDIADFLHGIGEQINTPPAGVDAKDMKLFDMDSLNPLRDTSIVPEITIAEDYGEYFVHAPIAHDITCIAATKVALFYGSAMSDKDCVATWLGQCKTPTIHFHRKKKEIGPGEGAPTYFTFKGHDVKSLLYIGGPMEGRKLDSTDCVCYCSSGVYDPTDTQGGTATPPINLNSVCAKPYACV